MKKDIPIYQIKIDDFDETGVELISIVRDPAIEVKGILLSKNIDLEIVDGFVNSSNVDSYKYNTQSGELILTFNDGSRYRYSGVDFNDYENVVLGDAQCITEGSNEFGSWYVGKSPSVGAAVWETLINSSTRYERLNSEVIFKLSSEEKRKIIAPALIPDINIYRKDGDGEYYITFEAHVIEQIVEKFFKSGTNRKINFNHTNKMVDCYIVSSWIKTSMSDKSNDYGYELPIGTWFVELKIEDEKFWQNEVKKMGFNSLSIEGILGLVKVSMSRTKLSLEEVIDSITFEDLEKLWNDLK